MTLSDLPDRWDDEPWPLDDPVDTPGFRPTNWSDTHAEPPQVADLADEAWEYAIDRGISMERALAELQRQRVAPNYGSIATGGVVKTAVTVPITEEMLNDLRTRMMNQLVTGSAYVAADDLKSVNPAIVDRVDADALLDEIKNDPIPRRTLDYWTPRYAADRKPNGDKS